MHGVVYLAFAAAVWVVGSLTPTAPAPVAIQQDFAPLATSTDASYNWSGYVADDGVYTAVSGTWVVPESAPHPGAELSAEATWVGIGGAGVRDLIQAGTQALADSDGNVVYSAWYETLPEASKPVPFDVKPGDTVTVSVTLIGEAIPRTEQLWHIGFTNDTTGKTYSFTVPYRSSLTSAEWVMEMPSLARHGGFIPITSFGSVSFLAGSAVKDGDAVSIALADAEPLRMTSRAGDALAVPTALRESGGFSVLRTDEFVTNPQEIRLFLLPDL